MNQEILKSDYLDFFSDFKIDVQTGVLENYPEQKFVTMPYIGSQYANAELKILFVGQDVGRDETPNKIQTFENRNEAIEQDSFFNPHIAGTYCTALYLLKEIYQWEEVWDEHKKYATYSQATKAVLHRKGENPLSFVALSNLHKFVNVNRENRAGSENRKFLNREFEEGILIKEIEVLKPKIIVFQGKLPSQKTIDLIKSKNIQIHLAKHPSYRKKGGRNPVKYIETLEPR